MGDFQILLHRPGNEVIMGEEFNYIQAYLNDFKKEMLIENKLTDPRKIERIDFIGAQPVSMRNSHVDRIREERDAGEFSYIVCEKTDGVRYIMVITNNGNCYLTGRNTSTDSVNKYKLNEIKVQLNKQLFIDEDDEEEENLQILQIFDGELVLDKKGDNYYLKYLIFDCIVHFGEKIFANNYLERLTNAIYFVQYNNSLYEIKGEEPPKPQPFCENKAKVLSQFLETGETDNFEDSENDIVISICVKDFFKIKYCNYLFDNYIPSLPHHNDGLIFTKNNSLYRPGTDENIIKWKPPSMNTIDFLLVANKDNILCGIDEKRNDGNYLLQSRVIDLYVMDHNSERKNYEIAFFDFMIVDEDFFEEVIQKTEEKEGAKGIVAECKWVDLDQEKGDLIKKIYTSDTDKILVLPEFPDDSNQDDTRKWIASQKQTYKESKYTKGWGFDRYRLDKNFSNNKKIAKDIVSSIKENLDSKALMQRLMPNVNLNPNMGNPNLEPAIQKKQRR
ncbi:hypothetical protein ABPG74_015288 [Tetrahymena malaccensis]